jgi:hypothetical protein
VPLLLQVQPPRSQHHPLMHRPLLVEQRPLLLERLLERRRRVPVEPVDLVELPLLPLSVLLEQLQLLLLGIYKD